MEQLSSLRTVGKLCHRRCRASAKLSRHGSDVLCIYNVQRAFLKGNTYSANACGVFSESGSAAVVRSLLKKKKNCISVSLGFFDFTFPAWFNLPFVRQKSKRTASFGRIAGHALSPAQRQTVDWMDGKGRSQADGEAGDDDRGKESVLIITQRRNVISSHSHSGFLFIFLGDALESHWHPCSAGC